MESDIDVLVVVNWEAGEYGEGQVAVKIVDVLDEEWFETVEE